MAPKKKKTESSKTGMKRGRTTRSMAKASDPDLVQIGLNESEIAEAARMIEPPAVNFNSNRSPIATTKLRKIRSEVGKGKAKKKVTEVKFAEGDQIIDMEVEADGLESEMNASTNDNETDDEPDAEVSFNMAQQSDNNNNTTIDSESEDESQGSTSGNENKK